MKIEKANWTSDGDNIRITMPLQKVDKERRIVSGFATLDSEDLHGDVVTKEASAKAFANFRGNIRLMHQPIPAGKLVNAREEEFFDSKTQKVYTGIYVDAYISKGAEHIWEMVNDGTLTGFSIGGNVKDAKTEFSKDAGKSIRYIKDYEMVELSLVDNPANQLSNILSIQKSADGSTEVDGMLAKMQIENVFYCKKGDEPVAIVASDETKNCVDCGAPMQNIGWFESDGGDRAEKVNSIVEKFEADSTEGGENMARAKVTKDETPDTPQEKGEEQSTTVETAEEVAPAGDENVIAPEGEEAASATNVEEENVTVTGTGESKTEEAKQLNEETDFKDGEEKENPLTKMFEELSQSIQKSLDANSEKTANIVAEATAGFEKKLGELAEKHDELSNKFGTLTEKFNNVEKSLDSVEQSGAIKKSADLGGEAESSTTLKKSRWAGSGFSLSGING
jgi:phage head maturation protease